MNDRADVDKKYEVFFSAERRTVYVWLHYIGLYIYKYMCVGKNWGSPYTTPLFTLYILPNT